MRISIDVTLSVGDCSSRSIFTTALGDVGRLVDLDGLHLDIVSVEQSNSPAKTPVDVALHGVKPGSTLCPNVTHAVTLQGSTTDVHELARRYLG